MWPLSLPGVATVGSVPLAQERVLRALCVSRSPSSAGMRVDYQGSPRSAVSSLRHIRHRPPEQRHDAPACQHPKHVDNHHDDSEGSAHVHVEQRNGRALEVLHGECEDDYRKASDNDRVEPAHDCLQIAQEGAAVVGPSSKYSSSAVTNEPREWARRRQQRGTGQKRLGCSCGRRGKAPLAHGIQRDRCLFVVVPLGDVWLSWEWSGWINVGAYGDEWRDRFRRIGASLVLNHDRYAVVVSAHRWPWIGALERRRHQSYSIRCQLRRNARVRHHSRGDRPVFHGGYRAFYCADALRLVWLGSWLAPLDRTHAFDVM